MKTLAIILTLIAAPALAQSPSLEQVEQALSIERMAGNNALTIKDQRIAELQRRIAELTAKLASCEKPPSSAPR